MTELEMLEQIMCGVKICVGSMMAIIFLIFVWFSCYMISRWWKK